MPRHARIIFPGIPHHVTQRGNHREPVFFSEADCLAYLHLLQEKCRAYAVELISYCLMTNHVHLVAVPSDAEGLKLAIGQVNGQYAMRINRMRKQTGHLWQARYFSSPLDPGYFARAVRYVECNPVRAGMVARAEDFAWSSAAARCGLRDDRLIVPHDRLRELRAIADWSRWLSEGVDDRSLEVLRRNASQNLPCGSDDFVERLEKLAGRSLRYRLPGRQAEGKGDSHF